MVADLVIRHGTIVDGSGAPAYESDIAIENGLIAEIGPSLGRGRQEIDAEGALVTPGFIDPHTHYDGQATWDPVLAPSSIHGVTTVVMGNCGVGFAPVAPDRHDWLIETMEGVEDIPGTALHEGLRWNWESFPEYLDALAAQPRTIDVATHLPHVALRGYVMGEDGANPDAHPDQAGREEMVRLLHEALAAGAVGVSTSRTNRHMTKAGHPLGTLRTEEPELFALAEGLRTAGRGVLQFVSDLYQTTDDDFAERESELLRGLVRATGRPASFTVQQDDAAPHRWQEMLDLASAMAQEGLAVRTQVAPRPIGVLLGLEASANVFSPTRTWGRLAGLDADERLRALHDPEVRTRIIESHRAITEGPDAFGGLAFFARFDDMYLLDSPANYDFTPEDSLGARAKRSGVDPRELAYDLQLASGGTQLIYRPLFNFSDHSLDVVHQMVTHPLAMFGLSDAGAHCGQICDGSTPTSFLTLWARDRHHSPAGDGLPVETVVHHLTQGVARHFGWTDRGLLAPGLRADLNVLDLEALACRAPKMVHDLPAGGGRLLQEADGYRMTLKNGVATFVNGESTGALPGGLIR